MTLDEIIVRASHPNITFPPVKIEKYYCGSLIPTPTEGGAKIPLKCEVGVVVEGVTVFARAYSPLLDVPDEVSTDDEFVRLKSEKEQETFKLIEESLVEDMAARGLFAAYQDIKKRDEIPT